MKFKLPDTSPIIEQISGQKLKSDTKTLQRLIELWLQLDTEESVYDKPFGLTIKQTSDKDRREYLKDRLLKSGDIRVVKLGDQVIGMTIVSQAEFEKCYRISALVIDKPYRNKGYGKLLLQKIFDSKPDERAMLRVSCGNTEGLSLYKSLGFKPVSMIMMK